MYAISTPSLYMTLVSAFTKVSMESSAFKSHIKYHLSYSESVVYVKFFYLTSPLIQYEILSGQMTAYFLMS